jgi:hypothetical protein
MKYVLQIIFAVLLSNSLLAVELKYDNGAPKGNMNAPSRIGWEESVLLLPAGPCTISKIRIYYYGTEAVKDTIYICGFPTAGNLYPTEYIWDYNTLVSPIIVDYDGKEGWKEYDITSSGLKSDGLDKIVIQHKMKEKGPFFGYDNNGRQGQLSWYSDPFTPNSQFYNIQGSIHYTTQGDYMVRLELTYLYPDGTGSKFPPPPTFVQMPFNMSGENSIVDIDRDGWDDVVLGASVFKNTYTADGAFENISSKTKISAAGTNWVDYDNDGAVDCYAFLNSTPDWDKRMVQSFDKIYKNTGLGTFTQMTNDQVFVKPFPNPATDFKLGTGEKNETYFNPYNTCTPFWVDYNTDGWPDLFIANKRIEIANKTEIYCPDEIWLNNKNGTFTNRRVETNISSGEPYTNVDSLNSGGYYDCYGAAAVDYNNDMKPDIFVANYRLAPDNLYKNNGNGTFTDVGATTGVRGTPTAASNYFGHGMGSSWGDFNNDGLMDLCVGNLAHTDSRGMYSNPSLIFKNKKSGNEYVFDEVHKQMGLKFHEGNAGACWTDFDNDGYQDLWHGKYSGGPGAFYLNQGPPDYKLKDITWDVNCIMDSPWEGVRLDFDNDGDQDMLIKGSIIRNDLSVKGNWVIIRLGGSPVDRISNDALGTKVVVYAGGKAFYREFMGTAAGTHSNQNSNQLHFGIGKAEVIDSVVITYQNNQKNVITNLTPNVNYYVPYMLKPKYSFIATPSLIAPKNLITRLQTNVSLSWYKSGFAKKYQVQVSDKNSFSTTIIDKTLDNGINNLDVDLTTGKQYYWRVKAIADTMNSAWSSVWSFVCGVPTYGSIKLLAPADNALNVGTKITFSWSHVKFTDLSFMPYTTYKLQISEAQDFGTILYESDKTKDSFLVVTGITKPTTKYYWRVLPIVEEVQGTWTQPFSFTTMGLPAKVTLTTPVDGATEVSTRGNLSWTMDPTATNYWVQVAENIDFEPIKFERRQTQKTPVTIIPRLAGETKYYWRVAGNNEGGTGPWSEVWSFTTEKVISVDEQQLELDWNIVPNPADERMRIEIKFPYQRDFSDVKLHLFDLQGNLVAELTAGLMIIDKIQLELITSNIKSGAYFLKLWGKDFEDSRQIIIAH